MPGGSPSFRDEADIECLYEDLEILFDELSGWCRGMTLKEFHAWFTESHSRETSGDLEGRIADRAAQEMAGA
jgi:hypothetical protein